MAPRWFLWALLLGACDRARTTPPAQEASVRAPQPTAPPSASSAAAPLPSGSPSSTPMPAPNASGAGGPWVGCYAHFRPTSTPFRDVTRLGLLCGPAGGMRPIAPAYQGTLAEGNTREYPFSLERGQCVRAFAVADSGLPDLDLALLDPQGATLGSDQIEDRWPILPPDGTLCATTSGTFRLRVSARKGSGAYAAQLWLLP